MDSVNINCFLPTHIDIDISPRSEGQGFIIVYSITSRSTFERLDILYQSMRRVLNHNPVFVIVGNKCDRTLEREVSVDEGVALAKKFGCKFMETSAKTVQNVEDVFVNLIRALRKTRHVESSLPAKKENGSECIIL